MIVENEIYLNEELLNIFEDKNAKGIYRFTESEIIIYDNFEGKNYKIFNPFVSEILKISKREQIDKNLNLVIVPVNKDNPNLKELGKESYDLKVLFRIWDIFKEEHSKGITFFYENYQRLYNDLYVNDLIKLQKTFVYDMNENVYGSDYVPQYLKMSFNEYRQQRPIVLTELSIGNFGFINGLYNAFLNYYNTKPLLQAQFSQSKSKYNAQLKAKSTTDIHQILCFILEKITIRKANGREINFKDLKPSIDMVNRSLNLVFEEIKKEDVEYYKNIILDDLNLIEIELKLKRDKKIIYETINNLKNINNKHNTVGKSLSVDKIKHIWFFIGINLLNGEIERLYKTNLNFTEIAKVLAKDTDYNFKSLRPYISESYNNTTKSDKNILTKKKKNLNLLLEYFKNNKMEIINKYKYLLTD